RRNLSLFPTWFSKVQSGDMALFTIIASQGPLYRIDAPMSVYRKNAAGITNAIQKEEYHTNRIKLFSYFEEYLEGREQEKINEVIHFHQQKLKKLQPTSLKNRIKKFLKP
ncbi:MAG: hypothetical protein KDC91_06695, partial [Flavobacteriaceae bacterium]|nr:hypothetical protein [Flavobacteriaceae bacterium]